MATIFFKDVDSLDRESMKKVLKESLCAELQEAYDKIWEFDKLGATTYDTCVNAAFNILKDNIPRMENYGSSSFTFAINPTGFTVSLGKCTFGIKFTIVNDSKLKYRLSIGYNAPVFILKNGPTYAVLNSEGWQQSLGRIKGNKY